MFNVLALPVLSTAVLAASCREIVVFNENGNSLTVYGAGYLNKHTDINQQEDQQLEEDRLQ